VDGPVVTGALASITPPVERAERYRAAGLWDDRVLADGIETAAARRPDAVALVDDEVSVSYAQLAAHLRAAALGLAAHDAGGDRGVVLVTGNTVAGAVAYHALLRAGTPVVLLDRRCGTADVRAALDALGGTGAVLAPDALRAPLLDGVAGARPLSLDDLARSALAAATRAVGPPAAGPSAPSSSREPDRDRPAVVLLTSGTTGRPKAVVHSVNTLTAGARNMARITGSDASTVVYLVSPLASITGVMQLHLCADLHATLVLDDRFESQRSLERINALGATLLGGAPVILERLLGAAAAGPDPHVSLRSVAIGGSMLSRQLLELATDGFGIEVARVYGSSEAPNSTGSLPGDDRERRLADDGALLPGTEVRVGTGDSPQEGMVQGPAVFLGYVDPVDTAAAFVDGWYRTGDAVELHDGRLTVLGRLKDVVDRNGLKISLGELDAALAGCTGIVEHACFGVPDPETGERLAVAVVPAPGGAVSLRDVVDHLVAAGVAVRKLPEQLVVWDRPLPRTASGKVVRSRLAAESAALPSTFADRLAHAGGAS
jgi:acyl-CoA synthetase (AMP-forming)/AMP-acid ligase II